MNTPLKNATESEETRSSRFAYHGEDEEPGEGGVRSVNPDAAGTDAERMARGGVGGAGENAGSNAARARGEVRTGVPGPEERLLDISELARTVGMHYTHVFSLPPYKDADMETVAPLYGEITLTNTGALLLLRGHVETTLRLECGRCLNPMDEPVEAELEEEFDLVAASSGPIRNPSEEVHAVDEDTPAAVIKGNILDLADLLRQNLLLAQPLQPLCDEECPGIPYDAAPPADTTTLPPELNPLRRLADLLEAKRQAEGEVG